MSTTATKDDISFAETEPVDEDGQTKVTVTATILNKNALTTEDVTIDSSASGSNHEIDYTTKLTAKTDILNKEGDKAIEIPRAFVEDSAKKGTYTYTAEGTKAYYSQDENETQKITYNEQEGGQPFTVSGLKTGLKFSNFKTSEDGTTLTFGNKTTDSIKYFAVDSSSGGVTLYAGALPTSETSRNNITFKDDNEDDGATTR